MALAWIYVSFDEKPPAPIVLRILGLNGRGGLSFPGKNSYAVFEPVVVCKPLSGIEKYYY